MTLPEYIEANKPKGRISKKALKEHNRALHAAWHHTYVQMPNVVLKRAKQIINS